MAMHLSQKPCPSGRKNKLLELMFFLGVLCVSMSVFAQDGQDTGFYENQKEGWFWYQDPPHVPEEEEQEIPPPVQAIARQQQPENQYRTADLTQISLDDIWNLYPDDFQELLDHVQNLAVQSPSEENTLRYLVMQDVARRKALAYTNSAMYVNQKYSNLFNVGQVYPTSKPGVTAKVQMQQQEIAQTIAKASSSHALIYFTSPTCGFCRKQDGILSYFSEKYRWSVKSVDITRQPGLAARFGIETTPTLLLIKKGMENYMTAAVGVVALTELERKLYRAVRILAGETKDNNFLMYDYQRGTAFDATSILNKESKQPWQGK